MEENKDICHRKLVEISIAKRPKNSMEHIKVEYPYNYFGSRGFIDILVETDHYRYNYIYEIKPFLENVGEFIRQLNQSKKILEQTNTPKIYTRVLNIFLTKENLDVIQQNFNTLKNIGDDFNIEVCDLFTKESICLTLRKYKTFEEFSTYLFMIYSKIFKEDFGYSLLISNKILKETIKNRLDI